MVKRPNLEIWSVEDGTELLAWKVSNEIITEKLPNPGIRVIKNPKQA